MFGSSPCLTSCLSGEERLNITNVALQKLENQFHSSLTVADSIFKVELDKLKKIYDENKAKIESELVRLREQLEGEETSNAKSLHKLKIYEEQSSSLNDALLNANKRNSSLMEGLTNCQSRMDIEDESGENVDSKIISELKCQLKIIEEQLKMAVGAESQALLRAEESNSLKINLQFKEHHFKQEKEMLIGQNKLLETQLENRTKEISLLKVEHSYSLLNLQSDLANQKDDIKRTQSQADNYKEDLVIKEKKILELANLLTDSRESEVKLEEKFHQELAAKEALLKVYKHASDTQVKRNNELEQTIKELRHSFQNASELSDSSRNTSDESDETLLVKYKHSNDECNRLKEELHKLNESVKNNKRGNVEEHMDTDDDIAQTIAASKNLLKKDLSRTQLYLEYFNVSDKLLKAQEQNKSLNRYMNQILEEIELKAPMLRQQRDDYGRALHNIEILQKQNDDYVEEMEKLRYQSEEHKHSYKLIEQKVKAGEHECDKLSQQISLLLVQLETSKDVQEPSPSNGDVENMSVDELVTFKNVSELQARNRQLLSLLDESKARMKEEKNQEAIELTREIKAKLESVHHQLEILQLEKNSLEGKVKVLSSQRDLYETMANRGKSNSKLGGKLNNYDVGDASTDESIEKLRSELKQVETELQKVRREHEVYREEKAKNDQLDKLELDRIRKLYKKMSNENLHLQSSLKSNEKCLMTLQESSSSFQRQLKAVEKNKDILHNIIARHEVTISSLREQILELTKRHAQAEFSASALKEEVTYLKDSEARLRSERESLHNAQSKQSLLALNLESIKNNLEKKDSSKLMWAENKVKNLSQENAKLTKRLENNQEWKMLQSRVKNLNESLESTKVELENTQKNLADANLTISQLKRGQQVQKIVLNRPRVTPPSAAVTSAVSAPQVSELQEQLNEERNKVQAMKTAAVQAQATIACLKKVVAEHEKQEQASSDEELKSRTRALAEMTSKVNSLSEKLKLSEENEKALKEEMSDKLMKMTEDLEERENELEEVQKQMEDAVASEKEATGKMDDLKKTMDEAQDQYKQEVMLHAADLKAISTLKEKHSLYSSQEEKLKKDKLIVQEELKYAKADFEKHEKEWRKASIATNERISELEKHNKDLLSNFTNLSENMSDMRGKLEQGDNSRVDASLSGDGEKFGEMAKYLQREVEIWTGKANLAEAELQRVKVQKELLESNVNRLKGELNEELKKNKEFESSATQNRELLIRVQNMDALADSNSVLRAEKQMLAAELIETSAKAESLEIEIQPLQRQLRELNESVADYATQCNDLEAERDKIVKQCQELEVRINKVRPEVLANLHEQINKFRKNVYERDAEIIRLKNQMSAHQKSAQQQIATKNKVIDELKTKIEQATDKIKTQDTQNETKNSLVSKLEEKCKDQQSTLCNQENTIKQLNLNRENERKKSQALQAQVAELKKSEENLHNEISTAKVRLDEMNEIEKSLTSANTQIKNQSEQIIMLRGVAMKYKKLSTAAQNAKNLGVDEDSNTSTTKEDAEENSSKEAEEKNAAIAAATALGKQNDAQKEEINKLQEELATLRTKLEEESNRPQLVDISQLQTQLDEKFEEVMKLKAVISQLRSNINRQINAQDEYKRMAGENENKLATLQADNADLRSKLQMRQKQIEILQQRQQQQQQQLTASKASSLPLIQEKISTEPPPTANIKPMASPVLPVVTSPRLQNPTGPSGLSRSIPTASIKPMVPLSGGDGAVSSTVVTLPQATVTPTSSIAPTTSQSSSTTGTIVAQAVVAVSSDSYTVAPTQRGVSSTLKWKMSQPGQSCENGDSLSQSQANDSSPQELSLVTPLQQGVDDQEQLAKPGSSSSGSTTQKRKIREDADEEDSEDECEVKRSRVVDESDEQQGEACSSSRNVVGESGEGMIVSSDEEEEPIPSSQRADVMEDDDEAGSQGEDVDIERSHGEARPSMHDVEGEREREAPQHLPSILHEPSSSSSRPTSPRVDHQYDENEDRLVPSTPRLFSRQSEEATQNDRVSSPQVPNQGDFAFGFSPRRMSQMRQIPDMALDAPQQSHEGVSDGHVGLVESRQSNLQMDDLQTVPQTRHHSAETVPDGNITSSGGEGTSSGSSLHLESCAEVAEGGSINSEAEAECGMDEEPDSGLDSSRSNNEDLSSRQHCEAETDSSCVESSEQQDQNHSSNLDSFAEKGDDEEISDGRSESNSQVSSPMRAPRLRIQDPFNQQQPQSSSNSSNVVRRIRPITWSPEEQAPSGDQQTNSSSSTSSSSSTVSARRLNLMGRKGPQ